MQSITVCLYSGLIKNDDHNIWITKLLSIGLEDFACPGSAEGIAANVNELNRSLSLLSSFLYLQSVLRLLYIHMFPAQPCSAHFFSLFADDNVEWALPVCLLVSFKNAMLQILAAPLLYFFYCNMQFHYNLKSGIWVGKNTQMAKSDSAVT